MNEFNFEPAEFIPFKNRDVLKKVRLVHGKDLEKYSNSKMKIKVTKNPHSIIIGDIFTRIKISDDLDKKQVLILGNPEPETYIPVAELINYHKVNCRNLYIFAMDEWADQDGNIAPETYPNGFLYAMKNNFYYRLDKNLRPPEDQIVGPTNKNLKDYSKMMEDLGGVDVCYGGIGWSGHIAFIDPGAKEFEGSLEEWKEMGPRIVTLNPFTIAQSCLDPDFGMSGDWSAIPPRAATIGPTQVISAKLRSSWNPFTIASTHVSWHRFTVRLAAHGPVTPLVPASILQTLRTDFYISKTIAEDIEFNKELSWY